MKIIFTGHAEMRMILRTISKQMVGEAIREPDKLIEAKFGRKQAIKRTNNHIFSVIFEEKNGEIIVITVHWGE